MRVTVLADNLNKALGVVSRVVSIKVQLPILANVLLVAKKEGLQILATDLETGVRIGVGAKIEEEGEVCVSGKVLAEFVATLGAGAVELSKDKESIRLSAGKARAQIPGIEASEFPSIPEFRNEADLVLSGKELLAVVGQTAMAAARDDSRPILTGMYWRLDKSGATVAATDGYRLSVSQIVTEIVKEELQGGSVTLPVKVLLEIVKGLDKTGKDKVEVKLERDKQQVIFRLNGVEWVSRLLAGEFPAYEQIIPKGWVSRTKVNREGLLESVRRAAVFARDGANIVKFKFESNRLVVGANGSVVGSGETEMEIELEGEPLAIAFNARYLLDYLGVVDAEEVVFESEGALKAGVFKVEKGKLTHIIMPVRVQE